MVCVCVHVNGVLYKNHKIYYTVSSSGLTISVDVITGNVESLPVASTCGQRMSIPLYPSYHTLKKKLFQAIQCQAYGLS